MYKRQELADQVLKNSNVSAVILLSENGFNEQIILEIAKKYSIKTILLQHGMYWETLELKEGNTFLGGDFPILSDKFLVWGNETKKYAEECGFAEKTDVIGSTVYDTLFDDIKTETPGDYILLATSSPQQNEIFDLSIKNLEKYEMIIKECYKIKITLSILMTAVRDIESATSPLAKEVKIFEVAPPGADASIITPIAISGDTGQIKTRINATIGNIIS